MGSLGIVYINIGQYEKAIDLYQKSLEIFRQIGALKEEGNLLILLGNAYGYLGQYQKSIDFYQRATVIVKQIGDLANEGATLMNLGIANYSLGKYQEAINFYQQSLAIYKQIGNRYGESVTLGNLGNVYNNLGQYQKAIDFHQQSLVIAKKIGDHKGEAASLNNLGGILYERFGHYQKAIDLFHQSLVIAKQIGDRDNEGNSLGNLGLSFSKLNQPELAIVYYKESINARESIRKDIRGLSKSEQRSYLETVARAYKTLADLLLKQGRVIEALQILDLLKVQELEDYLKNIKGSDRSAQGVRLLEPEKAIRDKLLAVSFENSPEINSQLASKIQQLPKSEINKVPDYLQKIPQGKALLYLRSCTIPERVK